MSWEKVPTTPEDPIKGILNSLEVVARKKYGINSRGVPGQL